MSNLPLELNAQPLYAPSTDAPIAANIPLVMLQMQQQQLEMQKQMTALMAQLPKLLPTNTQAAKPPTKLTKPVIDTDTSDNRWIIFKDEWRPYKDMARLSNTAEIRNEIRAACSQKVNECSLTLYVLIICRLQVRTISLVSSTVAVKTVHPEIYRQHFYNLKQSDGETITSFISRLKAQAMLCAFQCQGTCGNDTCTSSTPRK